MRILRSLEIHAKLFCFYSENYYLNRSKVLHINCFSGPEALHESPSRSRTFSKKMGALSPGDEVGRI